MEESMQSNDQIARMPISEVVNSPGGNGLASPAFQMPLNFLGSVGWQHVEEGVEALICDGQLVPRTNLTADWLRALGRNKFFRRVLLQPAPLTDISAKALTKDHLELSLVVSVKYHVVDPVYVASLQAPLIELTNLVTGIVAEYIRSDTLDNLISDDGKLRVELKKHLENSPSLYGHYAVTEILKALPTGDKRIIELVRKTREEASRRSLIEQQGANELVQAEYERRIERQKTELQDEFVARQHERDLEMQQIQLQAQTLRDVMETVAQIAASGMNPAGAIEEIRKLLNTEAAHAATPPRELTLSPSILSKGEDVFFTHFYPSAIESDTEAPLHVYVHHPSAIDNVRSDFAAHRSFDVAALTITERAKSQFERGTTFTIIPYVNGARIKPSRIDVKWEDAFERATFSIVLNANMPKGSGLTGEVRIYVGTLVIAQLPILFVVSDRSATRPNEINTQTHWKYRKIFVSYSRKDEAVVRAIERLYAKYPEIETYIDYKFLRASDYWWPKIQEKIEEAEALQLFWSVNAAGSSNVSDEWKYALKLQRPIIPIILEPKPAIPSELAHIHFEDFAHFIGEL